MTAILLAVLGKIYPFILGAMALIGVWFAGRSNGKARAAQRQAQGYQDTMEDALNAPIALSPHAARDSLRNRKPGQP